jgi:GAF domain-containing protein
MNTPDTNPRRAAVHSKPPTPANEAARLSALLQYRILDTAPEEIYDKFTRLASYICKTPISLVSLVDHDRQWFKSRVGLDAESTPRDMAFCAHAICDREITVVEDATADPRFSSNPLVTGDPRIRFYAGAPLINEEGLALGTLCVIDHQPHHLAPEESAALGDLSKLLIATLELRRTAIRLAEAQANIQTLSGLLPMCAYCKGIRDDSGYWQSVEAYIAQHSQAEFSHGICPECMDKHFPEVAARRSKSTS